MTMDMPAMLEAAAVTMDRPAMLEAAAMLEVGGGVGGGGDSGGASGGSSGAGDSGGICGDGGLRAWPQVRERVRVASMSHAPQSPPSKQQVAMLHSGWHAPSQQVA